MKDFYQTIAGLAVCGALVYAVYYFAVANYRECRGAGFSVRYCVLTHIIK